MFAELHVGWCMVRDDVEPCGAISDAGARDAGGTVTAPSKGVSLGELCASKQCWRSRAAASRAAASRAAASRAAANTAECCNRGVERHRHRWLSRREPSLGCSTRAPIVRTSSPRLRQDARISAWLARRAPVDRGFCDGSFGNEQQAIFSARGRAAAYSGVTDGAPSTSDEAQ
jgi:hypothetical protein